MINLRYHIVSLTAVFLAIGIGLTLGSTFLDRATVGNLQGQLESLEGRLDERDQQIQELEAQLREFRTSQEALDEQGTGLLAGQLDSVPVVVLTSRGVDEDDVDGAVQSLLVSGASVQGQWWLTERFLLSSEADVADLAAALGEDSTDPARLRRTAIAALGRELRLRQRAGLVDGDADPDDTGDDLEGGTTSTTETTLGDAAEEPEQQPDAPAAQVPGEADEGGDAIPLLTALVDAGFVQFEAGPGGADTPRFPEGTRLVIVGGSPDLPDDVVLLPLTERLVLGSSEPVPVVVGSAMSGENGISDIVAVVREDERLRTLVATVDDLEHFQDWAALVLALADVDDAVVGHYGVGQGATRLLPPLPPS